jgi:hypothetical protein
VAQGDFLPRRREEKISFCTLDFMVEQDEKKDEKPIIGQNFKTKIAHPCICEEEFLNLIIQY